MLVSKIKSFSFPHHVSFSFISLYKLLLLNKHKIIFFFHNAILKQLLDFFLHGKKIFINQFCELATSLISPNSKSKQACCGALENFLLNKSFILIQITHLNCYGLFRDDNFYGLPVVTMENSKILFYYGLQKVRIFLRKLKKIIVIRNVSKKVLSKRI